MSGYQVGPTCYSTAAEAVGAIASTQIGQVRETGSGLVALDVTAFDGASITYSLTPMAGGTPTTAQVGVSVPPCAMLDWSDGLQLGWLVGGVWIGVAALLYIGRIFQNEDHRGSEGYGNA